VYCVIKNPIQALSGDHYKSSHVCEEQHVLPQSKGGTHLSNIVWINKFEHTRTDRAGGKIWLSERPTTKFLSDDILVNSYMLGKEIKGYHFLRYDYSQENQDGWVLSLFKLDGVSHAVYTWGSITNFIAKEIEYVNYMVHVQKASSLGWWIDFVVGAFLDFIEVIIGVFYGVLGVIVGTIYNPIDTLTNIPMGIYYLADTTVVGIWNTAVEGFHFVTFGMLYD
jgi:hypothetical protein